MKQIHDIGSGNELVVAGHVHNQLRVTGFINVLLSDITNAFGFTLEQIVGQNVVSATTGTVGFHQSVFDGFIEDSFSQDLRQVQRFRKLLNRSAVSL